MNALVLAAGRGARLGLDLPKCLLEVGGRTLLDRQLDAFERVGVERVSVVVGYGAGAVARACRGRAALVENRHFATTNSLYSLWVGRDALRGETFLINGDVLADQGIYARLAVARGSAMAVDPSSGRDAEHMKVVASDGRVRRIGKHLPPDRAAGESLGLMKLGAACARALGRAAADLVAEGRSRTWAPAALDRILDRHPVEVADVGDAPWVEIDFPEDLHYARRVVAPKIDGPAVARVS